MKNNNLTLGWDIGGANLKVALIDRQGQALHVIQVACPLWRGLHELHSAVNQVLTRLNQQFPDSRSARHAVTMTGELADIFPDRQAGVGQIADVMSELLGSNLCFYAGRSGLIAKGAVVRHTSEIASANWLASAAFVAGQVEQGLFIDIGSTTADLVLLHEGQPQNRGFTDAERMRLDEMVYTGAIRTPLMSLAERVPFKGEWCSLAAEHFATTADVYRLTGELDEAEDMAETADGAGKTPQGSARRLARMIGHDLDDAPLSAWIGLAHAFRQAQLEKLKKAALRGYSRNLIDTNTPIVGAGAGSFLVKELAVQLGGEYVDVAGLIKGANGEVQHWAAVCLPAYAVACLAVDLKAAA